MKKLTGRFAAILLIAAMVMTMVSGCSNNASNETTKANAGDGSLAAAGASAEEDVYKRQLCGICGTGAYERIS